MVKKNLKFKSHTLTKILILESVLFLVLCSFVYLDLRFLAARRENINQPIVSAVSTPLPSSLPVVAPSSVSAPAVVATESSSYNSSHQVQTNSGPWGVATQLNAHTWTMKVGSDSRMATPQEILAALNDYRQVHGSPALAWDNNLATYAQSRADYFNSIGKLDEHAGFEAYVSNASNLEHNLNFYNLGENSSIGYQLLGVHLIEWVFAADEAHNENQLNPKWTHVGIGVSGTAVDLIFAY